MNMDGGGEDDDGFRYARFLGPSCKQQGSGRVAMHGLHFLENEGVDRG